MKPVLLIVDDNESYLGSLSHSLNSEYEVRTASSPEQAQALLSPLPDVVLLDLRLNEKDVDDREGQRLLHEIHLLSPDIPVLMITAHGDISTAVECMRLGAVDFLEKSYVSLPEIKARLEHAVQQGLISRRLIQLEQNFTRLNRATSLAKIRRLLT